jgi:hypothetical protein
MLNACAPGVAVVNIDNGFGAGYLAGMIVRRLRAPSEVDGVPSDFTGLESANLGRRASDTS